MISIVVPVFNEADQIETFLHHLQPYRDAGHELILVDGGSCDGTQKRALPWVDHLLNSPLGRARQMNAGAEIARGNLLLFLHVDSYLPDSALHRLPSVSEVSWGRFDVRLSPGHWLFPVISQMMNIRSCVTGIATGDQAIFIGRQLFDSVQGFPDQPLMEDIEVSARLRKASRPICLKDKVVTSSRRWLNKGPWRTVFLMWRLRFAYFLGRSPNQLAAIYYPNMNNQI